ncbi:MAG: DUF2752 domain-containing protein [Terriglobales bacterium]
MSLRRDPVFLLLGVILATLGIAALRIFDPATAGVFPPCLVHALTGWYCPGCGSLRALHQLLHGNVGNAFALNPLAVLALPFLAYGAASYASFVIWGRYLPRIFLPAVWIRALCVAIVVFGIVRNIPVYPFSLLTPGARLGLH